MKTAALLLITSSLGLFSCHKEREKTLQPEKSLIKTWQKTEYLADPGDGSGTWQRTPENQKETLQFTTDGRILRNGDQIFTYTVSGDTILLDGHRDRFDRRWLITELTTNRLEIRLPCFEACGERYTAVSAK